MNMEAYSSSYSSSSKSSNLISQNPGEAKRQILQEYPSQSQYWLHSIRKSSSSSSSSQIAKPWKVKKAPVAPAMPSKAVKVYKVDALNFRELVQQLTGAPAYSAAAEATTTSHHDVADSSSQPVPNTNNNNWYYLQGLQSDAFGVKSSQESAGDGVIMAPSSYSNWCSFPPLSPGTITSFEPNRVL